MNKVTKTIAGLAIAGVAVAGLAACSNPTPTPTQSASSNTVSPDVNPTPVETPIGGDIIAPVSVNLADINGSTQNLVVGQVLNLNVADQDPSVWSGVSSDTTVATVTEGKIDGTATMNPGVTGVKAGTSTVTFTNSFTKEVVTFTVTVAE